VAPQVDKNVDATKTLEQDVGNLATSQPDESGAAIVNSSKYLVRLSNYYQRNCRNAEKDLALFKGVFPVEPRLYSQGTTWVVVALPASSAEQGKAFENQAHDLADHLRFKGESLANARLKTNPAWILTTCEKLSK
jgi:hypothetical protein